MNRYTTICSLIETQKTQIIDDWVNAITDSSTDNNSREATDCALLLEHVYQCISSEHEDIKTLEEYRSLEAELTSFASYRAINNFTPTQTANYLLELKKTVYKLLSLSAPDTLQAEFIPFNEFIDGLAVLTFQIYSDAREEVISSQAHALEHDTPIVKISSNILLMPLMGIIDTIRAQKIIESLLDGVVQTQSEIAIIDMTAVPTFDTHVANNILKTIAAAKMVGTQVVISGISPSVAMTIVKLGVDLSAVETFNTLENAIAYSYQRTHSILTHEA
jgi:rsbT co-antagonist protein RsbR